MKRMKRCFIMIVVVFLSMTLFAIEAFSGSGAPEGGTPCAGVVVDPKAKGEVVWGTMFAMVYDYDAGTGDAQLNVIMNLHKWNKFQTLSATTSAPATCPVDVENSIISLMTPKISHAFFRDRNINIKVKYLGDYAQVNDNDCSQLELGDLCSMLQSYDGIYSTYVLTNIVLAVTKSNVLK